MPARAAFAIEPLAVTELSQNVTLSRSVGWHDVDSEWRVLHEAAEVAGVRHEGRVVAQGALGDYGNCASLAKMVVATELQRRGLGARLLDHFLAQADARGIPVGLCATDHGRPLYASRGFNVSGELMILFGSPELGTARDGSVVSALDVERAVEQDRQLSGCDRGRMLRARFREASARLALASGRRGFGLATLQGEHALIGPILAENEQDAQALCEALLVAVARPARIDVPLQHVELRRWLVQLGLREMSVRVEMARAAARLPWQVPERFALATQAWG
jgi:GNAT superfamily N-acetyltransferase